MDLSLPSCTTKCYVRLQLAARASKSDPDLDILEAVTSVDKQIVEVARTRLEASLKSAGVKPLGASGGTGLVDIANVAAEQLRRQQKSALTAASAMANQNQHQNRSKGSGESKHRTPSSGSDEPHSRRQAKRKNYWKGVKDNGKARKKGNQWQPKKRNW